MDAGCFRHWHGHRLSFSGPLLRGIHADLTLCPDLGPVLAATCALAPEPSTLTGLQTLPHKECDRLEASADLVRWLGGEADIIGDHTLEIRPVIASRRHVPRVPFNPQNDHRMAFAAAVGALRYGGELQDPACVAKTFPEFWAVWKEMLQGNS
jgi:3-phosphoshikimate 1-carboxyvinyltransferase